MSDTPIYDATRATQEASHKAGYLEGRNTMREDVLAIARGVRRPGAQLKALIRKLEAIDLKDK